MNQGQSKVDIMTETKTHIYKCLKCGKDIEMDINTTKKVICRYCGYRILEKRRPKTKKRVEAR